MKKSVYRIMAIAAILILVLLTLAPIVYVIGPTIPAASKVPIQGTLAASPLKTTSLPPAPDGEGP